MRSTLFVHAPVAALFCGALIWQAPLVHAGVISFDLTALSLATTAGDTVSFTGAVTNDSGGDLNASDFFFNFFGFDPSAVTPSQDLGVVTDFLIPNGTSSGLVELFDVQLGSVAPGSIFPIDVQLEDTNSDLSDVQTVFVSNGPVTGIPEPSILVMVGIGMIAIGLGHKRKRYLWLVTGLTAVLGAPMAEAQGLAPAFSTQTPISGLVGNNFIIAIALVNTGPGIAGGVSVTGASLGAVNALGPSPLMAIGSMQPNEYDVVTLQFDGGGVSLGRTYLLTVRGTYVSGGRTLGFGVSRILTASSADSLAASELQEWLALGALQAELQSLVATDSPSVQNQQILTFLRSRPDFVDSDIDPGSLSVWGQFSSGRMVIIPNDLSMPGNASLVPSGVGATPSFADLRMESHKPIAIKQRSIPRDATGSETGEIPLLASARILNGLGFGWVHHDAVDGGAGTVSNVASWLTKGNYQVSSGDATIAALMGAGGEGVFYVAGHGGFGGRPKVFGLSTSTVISPDLNKAFKSDLDSHVISYFPTRDLDPLTGKIQRKIHYGITASFVRKYFQNYPPNSFVYIDACNSDSPDAADFKQAFFDKQASLYAGWESLQGVQVKEFVSAYTAALVFERLLGANEYCPEDGKPVCSNGHAVPPVFAQRPFDLLSVSGDLILHGACLENDCVQELGVFGNTSLSFRPNTASGQNSTFGMLAPSIEYVVTNEPLNQLFIVGSFGTDPRITGAPSDASVTAGGVKVNIQSWDPNLIVTDLPQFGQAGSVGDIIVSARNHQSNAARLTEWQGQFTYRATSSGSLRQDFKFNVAFRADIREWRPAIHNPPIDNGGGGGLGFEAMSQTSGTFACSGTGTMSFPGQVNTYTWMGSASFVSVVPYQNSIGLAPPNTVYVAGAFQNHTQMLFQIDPANPPNLCSEMVHIVIFMPPGVVDMSDDAGTCYLTGASDTFTVTLDENAQITGGSLPFSNVPCSAPEQGGFPFGVQALLTWNPIPAVQDTAPDPNSAR